MISIDVEKAKVIAHEKRRATRTLEFEPYDRVIALNLPGQAQEAEAARVVIRDKYAQVQEHINAADNVDKLKAIIEAL